MIEKQRMAVIEVYNSNGKYEGLLDNATPYMKPWVTTLEKAKAFVSTTAERYRHRYIVKEI